MHPALSGLKERMKIEPLKMRVETFEIATLNQFLSIHYLTRIATNRGLQWYPYS